MKSALTSLLAGVVFAIGLGISGMTRPIKVIGFLDFFGAWDASLAVVMIGAVAVNFLAYRMTRSMRAPILAAEFSIPKRTDLDARLVIGAALFGVGWGLAGFCPGPALTSLASGAEPVAIFVVAMAAGTYLHWFVAQRTISQARRSEAILQAAADA